MKLWYFTLVFLFCIEFSISQISPSDSKKITKILGKNFIELTPQKSYPYSSLNKNVIADTSLIIPGDTTGIYFNNEFLLFRSAIHFKEGSEVKKMMNSNYVSVGEYQEFQNYVRDSIARETLFMSIKNDLEAIEYLDYKNNNYKIDFSNPSQDRILLRSSFNLNWDKKLTYDGEYETPLLTDMYLSQIERFYKKREFDDRKFIYSYLDIFETFESISNESIFELFPILKKTNPKLVSKSKIQFKVNSISDPYYWGLHSNSNRDELSVLAQVYNENLKNSPIIGINGAQANAFCHWKQDKIQKELDKYKLRYSVFVTSPEYENAQNYSTQNFTIPKRNYNLQWQVSDEEYNQFVVYVRDSSLREYLYSMVHDDIYASKLINFKNHYYSENYSAWVDFDKIDRAKNRQEFNLNFNTIINQKSPEIFKLINEYHQSSSNNNPNYRYSFLDAKKRSETGKFKATGKTSEINFGNGISQSWWGLSSYDEYKVPIGRGGFCEVANVFNHATGVRYHDNYRLFIRNEQINILPDSTSTETEIIKKITYEQALAFYHWKYPIQKIKATENWQDYVLPTKEQFERIQRGEDVIVEEKNLDYPSPLFRYVVHVYQRKN